MTTVLFGSTGAIQRFTVPDGYSALDLLVAGGAGVAVASQEIGAGVALPGGRGAVVRTRIDVTAGESLWIAVGALGSSTAAAGNGSGLAHGGSPGAGAATLVGRGAVSLANALVIAGGGGGGGEAGAGGDGGGIGGRSAGSGGGGLGGGQDPTYTAAAGESTTTDGCGAGAGGLVGGRAGTSADGKRGGGGGGSSRTPSGAELSSDNTGAGRVELSYGVPPYASDIITPATGDVVSSGADLPLAWAFHGAHADDVQAGATVTYTTPAGTFTTTASGKASRVIVDKALVQAGDASWSVVTRGVGTSDGPAATATFRIAPAPPTPAFTSPADGSTTTATYTDAVWTAAEQTAYRLVASTPDGSRVYSDTGWVANPATRSLRIPLAANGISTLLSLQVRGANGATSNAAQALVATNWTRPATPTVSAAPAPELAALRITRTHPTEAGRPPVVAETFEVLALAGPGYAAEGRHAITVDEQPDGTLLWRLPASEREYVVAVTAYDALGVPSQGISAPPDGVAGGWGIGPWGVGPWGV